MSQLENLLSRLTKVKGRAGNYTACCPAHDDKTPSLAVKEQDGKIILHCFGGCSVENIVGAVGMDMTDLFPPSDKTDYSRPAPKVKFFATDLLRVIALEAAIVSVAAYDMGRGKVLPKPDLDRLQLAYQRIHTAMESANG
jgi:hypothetical protein